MHNLQATLTALTPRMTKWRRNIHTYPEAAWLEYRTAAIIISELQKLGYTITLGEAAVCADSRYNPPHEEKYAREKARAILQGAEPSIVHRLGNGLTGLWVDMHFPSEQTHHLKKTAPQDPIIALRFDMDANELIECNETTHKPQTLEFRSQNNGLMHACGHDGHVAIGIGLAHALHSIRNDLYGTVRLIFQPAEEVGQGAKAMLDAGAMRNVHEVIGLHLGVQAEKSGKIICGTNHFLATTSFEVHIEGAAAHAGYAPQKGRNALLAAANAVQAIHAISRHGEGNTRVNVGQLRVDGAPNVVPAKAWFAGETRGANSDIDAWMIDEVKRISQGAALMYGCTSHFKRTGLCLSGYSDAVLAKEVYAIAQQMPYFTDIVLHEKFMASEDFTWFLGEVQKNGGQGTFIQLGMNRNSDHHTEKFDFDEEVLIHGVELLTRLIHSKLQRATTP